MDTKQWPPAGGAYDADTLVEALRQIPDTLRLSGRGKTGTVNEMIYFASQQGDGDADDASAVYRVELVHGLAQVTRIDGKGHTVVYRQAEDLPG